MKLETEKNPFIINNYQGKEYFCDREHNLDSLINNIKSELNTTLISIRRIGKTGLIKHLFEKLEA
jgi:AAA+ ATPase superfamily predicted ATPase